MGYTKYRYEDLKRLCNDVFQKFGYSEEDSEAITDVLLTSDLFGIESHGVQRLILYYSGIKMGRIDVNAKMEVVKETPLSAVIDAHDSMGQVASKKSMELAIKKAKQSGIGMVVTKNSNHFGIAGYYARMAAQEGLLGISMTNTEAIVVPTFGKTAMLGSNPIAISMPAEPVPFLLDMSTSVVTRGKVEVYGKNNKPLPLGWAIDSNGEISENANLILDCSKNKTNGGILPLGGASEIFGGHKGYGLSLAVEIFTSILSGGFFSTQVRRDPKIEKVCHSFLAIDYNMFGEKEEIEGRLSQLLQQIRNSEKTENASRIYTHGEKEMEAYYDRMENGILVNDTTQIEIHEICDNFGISFSDYLKSL